MLAAYINNIIYCIFNLAMFFSESTWNHHKTTFPGERYKVQYQSFSHTHTQSYSKITALRSRYIDCNGIHIDIAPINVIGGFNGKNNNSNGLENK